MNQFTSQSRIGLALGGGGARGLAHIGVLKGLERVQIPIHAIAGTSMGGLVGAAYATGLSAATLETEALRLARNNEFLKLIDLKPLRGSLFAGERIHAYLSERLGGQLTFSDLPIPLALIATDILSGQEVVLRQGSVIDAMRATMSVPGVFAPVEIDGYRLVDGGTLNNVPADVVQQMDVQTVIAVDVMPDFSANTPGEAPVVTGFIPRGLPAITHDLWRTVLLMMSAMTANKLAQVQPDLVIRPDIPDGVTLFQGFRRADEIIAAGDTAVAQVLPHLQQLWG